LEALSCSRHQCREFALGMTWANSARIFLDHVTQAARAGRKLSAPDASPPMKVSAGAEH